METIRLFHNYEIAETTSFQKEIKKIGSLNIYSKIKNVVYPQLKKNPYFGSNIKKLKGEFDGVYRFRIGDYRLFYKIDKEKVIIFILSLKPRKDSYN
jgi:mRNA interferase RelE/StbE